MLRIILAVSMFGSVSVFAYVNQGPTTLKTDGSRDDVNAAISAASDGYTVLIPTGSFTWTSGIVVSGKNIKITGAGSGRIIGRSTSTVTIGTGLKTFTTQSGLNITPGQTLLINRTGDNASFMQGTVAAYSDTTLDLDVTSIGGSGSKKLWIISTLAATTITHAAGGTTLFDLREDTTDKVELSGIRFVTATGTGDFVNINRISGGRPVLIHDCRFSIGKASMDCIQSDSNRGIIWNCTFDSAPFSMAPLAIHLKNAPSDSWTTPSTMGTADKSGTSNLYVEDCDFHAWLNAADFDDNGRVVVRHCLFNNAGVGSHGADTSPYGVRHYEFYDNEFVFNGYNDGTTFNLNWWFFLRGGTGVIADNIMPDINSTDYSNKLEINMTVMNLQRNGGLNACWGANVPGNQYPAPRQVGFGYVTGNAGSDSTTYKGDSEPLYIWGNTGKYSAGTTDYGGTACTNPDSSANYIVAGRDYFNNGTPKPGYVKYAYPHPLRSSTTQIAAPRNLRVVTP